MIIRAASCFVALLCLLLATYTHAQSRFWQNLNHSQDSVATFVSALKNPVFHSDTIHHGGDSVAIDTFSTYDTTWYTDTLATKTEFSQREVYDIMVLPSGVVIAATDSGILRTTDAGITWTYAKGLAIGDRYVRTLCMGKNAILYAGSVTLFYRSTNDGITWDSLPHKNVTGGIIQVRYSPRGILFAKDGGSNLKKTSDDGHTWTFIQGACYDVLTTPHGNVLVRGGYAMHFSSDDGATWPLDLDTAFAFAENTSTIVAAVKKDGKYLLEVSSDEGRSWASTTPWTWTSNTPLRGLGIAPTGQIFISHGQEYPWGSDTAYTLYAVDRAAPPMDVSYGVNHVFDCFAFDSSGHVYGGTLGGGIFRATLPPAKSLVGYRSPRPQSLSVFPNPVLGFASITFTPESSGYADISILNLLGLEVARVFSGELDASEHTFTWHADKVQPGMYECVVRVNGTTQTMPILVE